jgi:hypothetical protein
MSLVTKKHTDGSSAKMFDEAFGAATTSQGMIPAPMASVGSFMLIVNAPSTFTAVVTVWASNKPEPDETVDLDWVDISAAISDIPTISSLAAATNYMVQVPQPEGGALYYRLKMISSLGSANVACLATFKKMK